MAAYRSITVLESSTQGLSYTNGGTDSWYQGSDGGGPEVDIENVVGFPVEFDLVDSGSPGGGSGTSGVAPEPGSLILAGTGLLGLAGITR